MRCDNNWVSQRRKRSSTHSDNGLAISTVNTHAQLLGNMQSTICELDAVNDQTQTKKNKTADQQMQLNLEKTQRVYGADRSTVGIKLRAPECQCSGNFQTHTIPLRKYSNMHMYVKEICQISFTRTVCVKENYKTSLTKIKCLKNSLTVHGRPNIDAAEHRHFCDACPKWFYFLVRILFFFFLKKNFVDPLLHRFWKLLIAFSLTSRVCDYLVVGDGRLCRG